MVRFPFAADEYDRAGATLWLDAVDSLLSAYSPWLENIDREVTEHVRTTRVSVKGAPDLVIDPIQTDVTGTLPVADVLAGDCGSIIDAIDAEAMTEARALQAHLVEQYRAITAATGNVIDTAGRGLSHDLIRDLVERIELEFGPDGLPMLAFLATGQVAEAAAALPPMTEEQDAAWEEMIERKRATWNERRRRRLTATSTSAPVTPEDPSSTIRRPFATTEYDWAAARLLRDYIEARTTDFAPSLALFPRVESETPRTSRVRRQDDQQATIAPIRLRTFVRSDVAGAIAGNADRLRDALDDTARERAPKLVEFWQKNVDQAPGAGGIHKGASTLSWDSVMDMMENAAIGFDSDDNPTMRIVSRPSAPELGPSRPEQQVRMARLLERKRQEFHARRRRRLVS